MSFSRVGCQLAVLLVPACLFIFGCVTVAQGFVKNYSGLLATRFLLSLAEANVSPDAITSFPCTPSTSRAKNATALNFSIRWYKRNEAQKRFTFFFCSTSLAGAFGGLLAYSISGLQGKAGLAGWRWVFIIGESIFSVTVAMD